MTRPIRTVTAMEWVDKCTLFKGDEKVTHAIAFSAGKKHGFFEVFECIEGLYDILQEIIIDQGDIKIGYTEEQLNKLIAEYNRVKILVDDYEN